MIVVADASPIRYLVLIEQVVILPVLYGEIVLPSGVLSELTHISSPHPVRHWMEQLPEWVAVRHPGLPLPAFLSVLDLGERQAIALAEELGADLLLADDGAARYEAARRSIPVQGTLGILDLAAEHDLVDLQTNFRAGAKLIQFFLERDAQRKKL